MKKWCAELFICVLVACMMSRCVSVPGAAYPRVRLGSDGAPERPVQGPATTRSQAPRTPRGHRAFHFHSHYLIFKCKFAHKSFIVLLVG